jgi:hypothetical protein
VFAQEGFALSNRAAIDRLRLLIHKRRDAQLTSVVRLHDNVNGIETVVVGMEVATKVRRAK